MKKIRIIGLFVASFAMSFATRALDTATTVNTPDISARRNDYYGGNREPLLPSPLVKLPLGAVKPQGWLRKQLENQASGFSGHLTEISPFCNKKNNAWLSKEGLGSNGWEEVPYWFRGFCALGYVLEDQRIMAESKEWLEAVIGSSREDGYFGPRSNLKAKGDHDMMPNMSMMYALRSHFEFTGDKRVIELMSKYFKWQLTIPDNKFFSGGWQVPRNADNLDSVVWLYNITGDASLLELADKLRRTGAAWMKEPTTCHNVDFSMGFRKPAQVYQFNKDPNYLRQSEKNFDSIYGIYGQVPGGMFAGDEFARPGYTDPRNAIETCGIVDMMLSEEILLRITGDGKWADRCENAAYNSLPAALTADMKALHYLTSVNQIVCDRRNKAPELADQGDMQSMNPFMHRCCQHNVSMGWPYFAESLWHATPGNGLAAVFYSACTVRAKVGDGTEVSIVESTSYPFEGKVEFVLDCTKSVKFPLYLRVPGWCAKAQVSVNGQNLPFEDRPGSYVRIERAWSKGDKVSFIMPMEVSVKRWEKQKNSASVNRGPLSFSLKIGEEYKKYGNNSTWPAWEILPMTPWNYGLILTPENQVPAIEVVQKPWPESNMVFTHEGSPIELRAKARKISNWSDTGMGLPGKLQASPVKSDEPTETVTLIPMGAARLRIASFPMISDAPDSHAWKPTDPMPASYWPAAKTLDFLRDGRLWDEDAKNVDCFKWIGWAGYATGEKHWVRQDFEQEETVASCEIFWVSQPDPAWLTSPEYWKLYYLDGTSWKEVELVGKYGFEPNRFTRVNFKAVKTKALKIEAQTKKKRSCGILEWRSWAQAGDLVKHSSIQNFGVDMMGDPVAKTVSSCEVTWHKDSADPKCQPPKSWKLYAMQGDQWKEVSHPSGYGLDPDKPNLVKFDSMQTTKMRLEVFAVPDVSAGPHDWKIKGDVKK